MVHFEGNTQNDIKSNKLISKLSYYLFNSDSNEDGKSAEKKQTKKKMKLEPKSQRSRLMQICDSSSDEEDASNGRDSEDVKMDVQEGVVVKKEKENKTPSPDKTANNKTNGSSSGKRRIKVKRPVTKTYEDDDGFISKSKKKNKLNMDGICQIHLFLNHYRHRSRNRRSQLFRRRRSSTTTEKVCSNHQQWKQFNCTKKENLTAGRKETRIDFKFFWKEISSNIK